MTDNLRAGDEDGADGDKKQQEVQCQDLDPEEVLTKSQSRLIKSHPEDGAAPVAVAQLCDEL